MKRKLAFSLAEILIAVIFIGIVSAMTIPNLSKSMDRKHKINAYVSAYKKLEDITSDYLVNNNGGTNFTDSKRQEFPVNNCYSDANTTVLKEQCLHDIAKLINGAVHPEYYSCQKVKDDIMTNKISYHAIWGSGRNAITEIAKKNRESVRNHKNCISRHASCPDYISFINWTIYSDERKQKLLQDIQNGIFNETEYLTTKEQAVRTSFGSEKVDQQYKCETPEGMSPWIVTSSGIAYATESRSSYTNGSANNDECGAKTYINSAPNIIEAWKRACGAIYVDYNGPLKGPNSFTSLKKQGLVGQIFNNAGNLTDVKELNFDDELEKIDRFVIFVGNDGIAAGPPENSLTGIIMHEYGGGK